MLAAAVSGPHHRIISVGRDLGDVGPGNHRAHGTGTAAANNHRAQTMLTPLEGLREGRKNKTHA